MWIAQNWKKGKYGRRKIFRTPKAMTQRAIEWEKLGYIVMAAKIGVRKWALWHW